MAETNLKQQKTFAAVRIIGGICAAIVLGYSSVSNLLAGVPLRGPLLGVALFTLLALAYAGFHTWRLGRLLEAEKRQNGG